MSVNWKALTGILAVLLAIALIWPDTIKQLISGEQTRAEAVGLLSVRDMNRLEVLQARFAAVVATETDVTLGGIRVPGTHKSTIMVAPGDVGYFIEMGSLTERSFQWDKARNTLTVTLPQPVTAKPNIDMRQVRTYVDGVTLPWNDRIGEIARKDNEAKIYQDIVKQATSPIVHDLARTSAKKAVGGLLLATLRSRGFADAAVEVSFET